MRVSWSVTKACLCGTNLPEVFLYTKLSKVCQIEFRRSLIAALVKTGVQLTA